MSKIDRLVVYVRLAFNKWYLHELRKQTQRRFPTTYDLRESISRQEETIASLEGCLKTC